MRTKCMFRTPLITPSICKSFAASWISYFLCTFQHLISLHITSKYVSSAMVTKLKHNLKYTSYAYGKAHSSKQTVTQQCSTLSRKENHFPLHYSPRCTTVALTVQADQKAGDEWYPAMGTVLAPLCIITTATCSDRCTALPVQSGPWQCSGKARPEKGCIISLHNQRIAAHV